MSTSSVATSAPRTTSFRLRTGRRSLAVLVMAGACALSVGPAPQPASAATAVAFQPLHISPGGVGLKNGISWQHAGDLKDLPRFIAARPSGRGVGARRRAFVQRSTMHIKSGGSAGAPVVVRGVAADGIPSAVPVLVGTQTSPYRVGRTTGGEVFKLYSGAST